MSNPPNKKLPDLANNGTYPYVDFTQFRSGSWTREDSTPGNESYSYGHISGSHHEFGPSGEYKHFSTSVASHYNQGGTSTTTEGNHHNKVSGSSASQTDGDHHAEHGGSATHASGGASVHLAGGSHYHHASGGTEHSTSGDQTTDHDGNIHHNTSGDHISFVNGVAYEHAGSEKGTYVEGNYDIKCGGNFQVSCKNFTISASVVTIKTAAGDITIESSGNITVKADGGTVTINASGDIITKGSTTKIQNGGSSGTPTTFS